MEISWGIIAKSTAAFGGVGTCCAGSLLANSSSSPIKNTVEDDEKDFDPNYEDVLFNPEHIRQKTSKYDDALIESLRKNNGAVKFISEGYSHMTTDASYHLKKPIKVKIEATEESLKKLNKNKEWTWVCNVLLVKDPAKNKLGEGIVNYALGRFLSKLEPDGETDFKVSFIEKCAVRRGEENSKINQMDEIKKGVTHWIIQNNRLNSRTNISSNW